MSRRKKNESGFLSTLSRACWKIALYIRLSKEDGNEVSNSIKNQEAKLRDYLENFDEEYELAGVYIDDGCTGTDTNREGFQRMTRHVKDGKINCVIVKDLSRLSRNLADSTYLIENVFMEYDIRFISLELPSLDSYKHPDQMNSILVPIHSVINDDFCRQTSIKIRSVFNIKRRDGQFIGAFAPYGYRKDPQDKHHFMIDEEAAQIVRDIFRWYTCDGLSKQTITQRLNALGIPNPTAYKHQKGEPYRNPHAKANTGLWSHHTVSTILKNQMYAGDMVQGRAKIKSYKVHKQIKMPESEWFVVPDTHEAIIERGLFEKTQMLLEKNTRTPNTKQEIYMFAGFCKCANCKGSMSRYKGSKYTYYRCKSHLEMVKEPGPPHAVRTDILEDVVLKAIQKQIEMVISLKEIIDAINERLIIVTDSNRLDKLKSKHEKEMTQLIDDMDNLYPDWKRGHISQTDYLRLKSKYEEQIGNLKQVIQNIDKEREEISKGIDSSNEYIRFFIKHQNIIKLDRNTIADLIKVIYIHAGGDVEIIFNFQDQYQMILDFIEANRESLVG